MRALATATVMQHRVKLLTQKLESVHTQRGRGRESLSDSGDRQRDKKDTENEKR